MNRPQEERKKRKKRRKKTLEKIETPLYQYFLLPLSYGFFKLIVLMVERITPAQTYLFARSLALLSWGLSSAHRKRAWRNLEIAYGKRFDLATRKKIAREVVQHFFLTVFDVLLLPRYFTGEKWRQVLKMSPEQEKQLQSLGKHKGPVAFHTGHLGSWEVSAMLATLFKRKLHFVYRPLDHPDVDRDLKKYRTLFGYEAHAKVGALKGYVRALRQNDWLGVIADQNAGRYASYLNFFGVAASTETRYFKLYQRFAPRVVTTFAIREGFSFRFHLEGIFETTPDPEADPEEEALRIGQWYLDCIEEVAKKYPAQYLWTHKRYASRPAGVPSLYSDPDKPLDPSLLTAQPKAPFTSPAR